MPDLRTKNGHACLMLSPRTRTRQVHPAGPSSSHPLPLQPGTHVLVVHGLELALLRLGRHGGRALPQPQALGRLGEAGVGIVARRAGELVRPAFGVGPARGL